MTEQERNLRIVRLLAILAGMALVAVLVLLYYGNELPFYEMEYQHTDPTGYRPPPSIASVTRAGVPRRVDLEAGAPEFSPSLPDLPDGAIPPQANALANPLAGDPSAAGRGKRVYEWNCIQCHGAAGRGDGAVAPHYVPAPTDLTRPETQALSDGALFYTITNGILSTPVPTAERNLPREWHAYKRVLRVEERWAAVSYMRTFGGTNATAR